MSRQMALVSTVLRSSAQNGIGRREQVVLPDLFLITNQNKYHLLFLVRINKQWRHLKRTATTTKQPQLLLLRFRLSQCLPNLHSPIWKVRGKNGDYVYVPPDSRPSQPISQPRQVTVKAPRQCFSLLKVFSSLTYYGRFKSLTQMMDLKPYTTLNSLTHFIFFHAITTCNFEQELLRVQDKLFFSQETVRIPSKRK